MFICEGCGKQSRKGEPRHTIITQTRGVLYFNERLDEEGGKVRVQSKGFEPVKEKKVGSCCLPKEEGDLS